MLKRLINLLLLIAKEWLKYIERERKLKLNYYLINCIDYQFFFSYVKVTLVMYFFSWKKK